MREAHIFTSVLICELQVSSTQAINNEKSHVFLQTNNLECINVHRNGKP